MKKFHHLFAHATLIYFTDIFFLCSDFQTWLKRLITLRSVYSETEDRCNVTKQYHLVNGKGSKILSHLHADKIFNENFSFYERVNANKTTKI